MEKITSNHEALTDKNYTTFPYEEWCSASIIAVSVAYVPANPQFSDSKDRQEMRFLFAGYVNDDNGVPTVVRKWSRWFGCSNNEKSAVMKFFGNGNTNTFKDLADFVLSPELLLSTPMKIMLESKAGKDGKVYGDIKSARPSADKESLNITYSLTDPNDPSKSHKPTKVIKHFAQFVDHLRFVCRTDEGLKDFTTEDMDEPRPQA